MASNEMKNWMKTEGGIFLKEIGINKNHTVLDFGCRHGTYTIPASKIVGSNGKVYSVDKNQEALDNLKHKASKNNLYNIETFKTEKNSKLPFEKNSMNVVLLYDVLHLIENKKSLLDKMYYFLKSDGFLSLYPKHHDKWMDMSLEEVIKLVESAGFVYDKKFFETLMHDDKLEEGVVLNFKKNE